MGGPSTVGVHWAVIETGERVNHHQEIEYTFLGGDKPGYIITYDTFDEKFPATGKLFKLRYSICHQLINFLMFGVFLQ